MNATADPTYTNIHHHHTPPPPYNNDTIQQQQQQQQQVRQVVLAAITHPSLCCVVTHHVPQLQIDATILFVDRIHHLFPSVHIFGGTNVGCTGPTASHFGNGSGFGNDEAGTRPLRIVFGHEVVGLGVDGVVGILQVWRASSPCHWSHYHAVLEHLTTQRHCRKEFQVQSHHCRKIFFLCVVESFCGGYVVLGCSKLLQGIQWFDASR